MEIEIGKDKMEYEITAMEVGPIEEGRQRCRFLSVALTDSTVHLLTLDPECCLEKISF